MTLGCLEMQLRSGLTLAQALTRVNKFLCERSSTSRFVTMFTISLDGSGEGTDTHREVKRGDARSRAAGDFIDTEDTGGVPS